MYVVIVKSLFLVFLVAKLFIHQTAIFFLIGHFLQPGRTPRSGLLLLPSVLLLPSFLFVSGLDLLQLGSWVHLPRFKLMSDSIMTSTNLNSFGSLLMKIHAGYSNFEDKLFPWISQFDYVCEIISMCPCQHKIELC